MASLPLPPLLLDEGTGHKLSPARKVPSSTWGPMETALPGASCFQLRGNQAHLLPSVSGDMHAPFVTVALPCARRCGAGEGSHPCSEAHDLDRRIRSRKKKPKWVLVMAVDSGAQKNVHLSTSWALAVVSAYTPPEMGSSPSPKETHSLVGQLNSEKAPINVGQNLSYDFSLVFDQCFGPHDSFTLSRMSVPQLSEGNMHSPCGPLGKPNPTSFLLIFSPSIFIESLLSVGCSATLLGAGVWWGRRRVSSPQLCILHSKCGREAEAKSKMVLNNICKEPRTG